MGGRAAPGEPHIIQPGLDLAHARLGGRASAEPRPLVDQVQQHPPLVDRHGRRFQALGRDRLPIVPRA